MIKKVNVMVKKTYIQPVCLVVALGTMHIIAASLGISQDGAKSITSSGQILVKENNVSDVNLWDKEW